MSHHPALPVAASQQLLLCDPMRQSYLLQSELARAEEELRSTRLRVQLPVEMFGKQLEERHDARAAQALEAEAHALPRA